MRLFHTIAAGLQSLLRRKKTEQELDEELGAFLELAAEEKMKCGMSRKEALREVRLERGNLEVSKELVRSGGWESFVETCWQDLLYAARTLRKSPSFTFVAVLTLALGIGANTAIFSVVYGVLLQPLPYHDAARLILLNETTPRVGTVSVSYPNFQDWRTQTSQFSQMAAVSDVGFNLAGVNQPEAIRGQAVSPNFLSLLGVKPFLGRDFDPSEEKAGASPVLLLSYSLWQSHFGADPSALGRTIMLDGRGYTIVGVLPRRLPLAGKEWMFSNRLACGSDRNPMRMLLSAAQRGDLVVLGRLAQAATFAQARSEMEGIATRLAKEYPGANDQFGVELKPIRDAFVSEMRPAILALFGAVIFVLLIACANVANLLLVRGSGRTREIALRLALGATRTRIVRQMLIESFLLALVGGGIGLFLAFAGIRGMTDMIGADQTLGRYRGDQGSSAALCSRNCGAWRHLSLVCFPRCARRRPMFWQI